MDKLWYAGSLGPSGGLNGGSVSVPFTTRAEAIEYAKANCLKGKAEQAAVFCMTDKLHFSHPPVIVTPLDGRVAAA